MHIQFGPRRTTLVLAVCLEKTHLKALSGHDAAEWRQRYGTRLVVSFLVNSYFRLILARHGSWRRTDTPRKSKRR
jgi:hypothetical protein